MPKRANIQNMAAGTLALKPYSFYFRYFYDLSYSLKSARESQLLATTVGVKGIEFHC